MQYPKYNKIKQIMGMKKKGNGILPEQDFVAWIFKRRKMILRRWVISPANLKRFIFYFFLLSQMWFQIEKFLIFLGFLQKCSRGERERSSRCVDFVWEEAVILGSTLFGAHHLFNAISSIISFLSQSTIGYGGFVDYVYGNTMVHNNSTYFLRNL